MALSYVIYEGDGAEDEFFFTNISLLDDDIVTYASQLKVYVDGILKTLTTDYSVNVANKKIIFGTAPGNGTEVKIQRFSKSDDRYITYTNSTNITASILNTDADHLFHLAQEALDLRDNAITLNTDDQYNANSKIITGLAPAVGSTDAVNLGQLNAAITGGNPATLGNQGYFTSTAGGTIFTLPTAVTGLSASDINVFVQGLKKIPTTDYTLSGNTLTFLSSVTVGHVLQVAWAKGVVPATFAVGELDTDMYKDLSVTAAKMDAEVATTGHVLKVTNTTAGACAFGTITAAAVSDFNTQVRTNRLDQMAAPTSSVNMGSQVITALASPTGSSDAVPKTYLDTNYKQVRRYRIPTTGRVQSGTTAITTTQVHTLAHDLGDAYKITVIAPTAVLNTANYGCNTVTALIVPSGLTTIIVPNIGSLSTAAATGSLINWTFTVTAGQIVINATALTAGHLVHSGTGASGHNAPTAGYQTRDWYIELEGA